MEYFFKLKKFSDLSITELYRILQLRNEVFIVEQDSPYLDLDNKDIDAYHCLIYVGDELAAYSRILQKNVTFKEASIGRVLVKKKFRSTGIGKILMEKSIDNLYHLLGQQPIRISAQCYAIPFYEKLGFKKDGEPYIEDRIEHIGMIKKS